MKISLPRLSMYSHGFQTSVLAFSHIHQTREG
jgi:hypothetical protein